MLLHPANDTRRERYLMAPLIVSLRSSNHRVGRASRSFHVLGYAAAVVGGGGNELVAAGVSLVLMSVTGGCRSVPWAAAQPSGQVSRHAGLWWVAAALPALVRR